MRTAPTADEHEVAIHREMETYGEMEIYDAAMFVGDAKTAAAATTRADKHRSALAQIRPIPASEARSSHPPDGLQHPRRRRRRWQLCPNAT